MSPSPPGEKLIGSLVPLESYRSPWIPTLRLGVPALLGVAHSKRGSDTTVAAVPSYWFAVDPPRRRVLAFSETAIVSPVARFTPEPLTGQPGSLAPRGAYGVWRDGFDEVASSFFTGGTIDADRAARLAEAYTTMLAPWLAPWLRECCGDYFTWLEVQAHSS